MEFTCETQYSVKTMALMAKVLRKTVRKSTAAVLISLDGLWQPLGCSLLRFISLWIFARLLLYWLS